MKEKIENTENIENIDFSDFTILIVDDDGAYRKFLSAVIKKNLKAKTIESGNPKDAFKILENETPDLIILDMQMPYMDGVTALRYIRGNPDTKYMPVIACTALSYQDLLMNLTKLNIADYIVKPANAKVVFNKLKKALLKIQSAKNDNEE